MGQRIPPLLVKIDQERRDNAERCFHCGARYDLGGVLFASTRVVMMAFAAGLLVGLAAGALAAFQAVG